MDLSIIITHHQTPAILKLCLRYLFKNLPSETKTEVFLADSKSRKDTGEILKEYPRVNLIAFDKNVGFPKLANSGIKKSRGKFVLIINADIIIDDKKTLSTMINYLKNDPDTGIVGPYLLNLDGSFQQSCFRYYNPLTIPCRRTWLKKTQICKDNLNRFLMKEKDLQQQNKPLSVDWLMGSALMIKKEALKKVGFFDENFFMYFEDVDLCKRFQKKGYRAVWLPTVIMYHYHLHSSRDKNIFTSLFNEYTRIHIKSAIKYFYKHRRH